MDTVDMLEYAVDIIEHNLEELVKINDKLSRYRLSDVNTLTITSDGELAGLLRASVDVRLKIVQVLGELESSVSLSEAASDPAGRELLQDLHTLASFYIYAGYRSDMRIARKYSGLIVVKGLEPSIEMLYKAFLRVAAKTQEAVDPA